MVAPAIFGATAGDFRPAVGVLGVTVPVLGAAVLDFGAAAEGVVTFETAVFCVAGFGVLGVNLDETAGVTAGDKGVLAMVDAGGEIRVAEADAFPTGVEAKAADATKFFVPPADLTVDTVSFELAFEIARDCGLEAGGDFKGLIFCRRDGAELCRAISALFSVFTELCIEILRLTTGFDVGVSAEDKLIFLNKQPIN